LDWRTLNAIDIVVVVVVVDDDVVVVGLIY